MNKNLLVYIFIYIFITGCENNPMTIVDNCTDCYLDLDAPDLVIDENGYYNMGFLDGYIQTFSTIRAMTGLDYEKIGWISNTEHCIEFMGLIECTDVVNQSSYTNEGGIAHTILGVWEDFVGDTITIYAGYYDDCQNQYLDSLKVIVGE